MAASSTAVFVQMMKMPNSKGLKKIKYSRKILSYYRKYSGFNLLQQNLVRISEI
jgi:hypothetical protein